MIRTLPALLAATAFGLAVVTAPAPTKADPSAATVAAIVIGGIAAGGLLIAAADAPPYYPAPYYAPGYYTPPPYYAPPPFYHGHTATFPPGCYRGQVYAAGAWRLVRICY